MKNNIGVHVPSILLPNNKVDMHKWSVVACDQYTSQPEYWDKAAELVGDAPSTLSITFPEVYLEMDGKEERINNINSTMKKYIEDQVLVAQKPGFILVDRKTSHSESRKGLIMAVDLDKYDYSKGSQSLIRATEGTVIERLPPRIKIRENAIVELPHIMILIDDEQKTVIEPIAAVADSLEKVYDFDLMLDGGSIKGYKIDDEAHISNIISSLEKLAQQDVFCSKYNVSKDVGTLLFAVGDGNHSLASAKAFWENLKVGLSEEERLTHPAKYALVEIVNVHDKGIQFEPIHRVVFDINPQDMLNQMVQYFKGMNCETFYETFDTLEKMHIEVNTYIQKQDCHVVPFISKDFSGFVVVNCPQLNLEVGTLQNFLDYYLSVNEESKIDYIHGSDVVQSLGTQQNNIGFFLPAMNKNDLFKTVILDGALPRKTFSMGEAEEKRFYLECRKII